MRKRGPMAFLTRRGGAAETGMSLIENAPKTMPEAHVPAAARDTARNTAPRNTVKALGGRSSNNGKEVSGASKNSARPAEAAAPTGSGMASKASNSPAPRNFGAGGNGAGVSGKPSPQRQQGGGGEELSGTETCGDATAKAE